MRTIVRFADQSKQGAAVSRDFIHGVCAISALMVQPIFKSIYITVIAVYLHSTIVYSDTGRRPTSSKLLRLPLLEVIAVHEL